MVTLTTWSWRDQPNNGWVINNKKIFPTNAFLDERDWLSHVCNLFPKIANKYYRTLQNIYPPYTDDYVTYIVFLLIKEFNKLTVIDKEKIVCGI